jgi:hypothetical protein
MLGLYSEVGWRTVYLGSPCVLLWFWDQRQLRHATVGRGSSRGVLEGRNWPDGVVRACGIKAFWRGSDSDYVEVYILPTICRSYRSTLGSVETPTYVLKTSFLGRFQFTPRSLHPAQIQHQLLSTSDCAEYKLYRENLIHNV